MHCSLTAIALLDGHGGATREGQRLGCVMLAGAVWCAESKPQLEMGWPALVLLQDAPLTFLNILNMFSR